ncbi:MipA/OmpV family protein [Nisaea sediminum]|uniref:MipA/OmpV family protein n=1 Tax=Nisaea sediminum TaxID=2775867 RepID=UPI00186896CB|nr:MipA/OmpV family protein [Nisaea sediminum]
MTAQILMISALAILGSSCSVLAEEPASDWDIQIGAGAMVKPDYEGSDDYEASPLPLVNISYKDLVFLDGPSLGANLFVWNGTRPGDQLKIGPLVRYQMGRDDDDNDALNGLGSVDGSAEIGGFISYDNGPFSAGLKAFQDVGDGHEGMTVELEGGYRHRFDETWSVQAGIATTWADEDYTQSFFGIDAGQSLRSGYREYSPDAGFKDVSLSIGVNYALTENWNVTGMVGYSRLLGDVADSPIVDGQGSADAFMTGIFVGYRF